MRFRHALIMAAGRGARMLPLTDIIPKPMAPYGASTLIATGIAKLAPHVSNIHITIGYKKAMLAAHVIEHGAASVICTEGHANSWWIHNTLMRNVDEPVLVLTADNVTDLDIDEIFGEYEALGRPLGMLVPVAPVPGLDGDFIHHTGQVVREIDRHKPAETYCSGIQVLNPSRIADLISEGADFYGIWRGLIAHGELKVSRKLPAKWFTVDTIEQLMAANADSPAKLTRP